MTDSHREEFGIIVHWFDDFKYFLHSGFFKWPKWMPHTDHLVPNLSKAATSEEFSGILIIAGRVNLGFKGLVKQRYSVLLDYQILVGRHLTLIQRHFLYRQVLTAASLIVVKVWMWLDMFLENWLELEERLLGCIENVDLHRISHVSNKYVEVNM